MAKYTYSVFDGSPNEGDCDAWPSHDQLAIEADSTEEALDDVLDLMSVEAAGLNASDGYESGDHIHAIVWDADGMIVGQPVYTLTADDMGDDDDDGVEDEDEERDTEVASERDTERW